MFCATQNRHPKTHYLKHPPIKPTPKQPPNQYPKPLKHPATTGEQSPPPIATTYGEQSPPSTTTTSETKTQKWKIFKPPLLSPSSYPCRHRPLLLLSLQPSSIWIERNREEARLWPGRGAHRGGSWRLVCVVFGWWENGGNKRKEKWVFVDTPFCNLHLTLYGR